MENELKLSILVSVLIHLIIITYTSIAFKRPIYISVPVELFFNSPLRVQAKAESKAEKEEIIIPKKIKPVIKKKDDKKKEVKKEIKKTEKKKEIVKTDMPPRVLTPSPQVNLDAAKFPYTYYANIIRKKIGGNWRYSDDFGYYKSATFVPSIESGNSLLSNHLRSSLEYNQ